MKIDNRNISEFGLISLRGSLNDLFRYPKRKAVMYNDWAESDRIEPDLTEVKFEPKSVKLIFLLRSGNMDDFWNRYNAFIAFLTAPGYRMFDFGDGIIHQLRYDAASAYTRPLPFNEQKNITSFTVDFMDDKNIFSESTEPVGTGIRARGYYAINGYDFGAFGIGSDKGIEDLLKYPAVKAPFTDDSMVSLETIRMRHKEIILSLWMIAGNRAEFIANRAAFFRQLSGTGTQELYINNIGTIRAYYSDCSSFSIVSWCDEKAACRFSISMVIPIVTWIDAGGETQIRVLSDEDSGYLADENGNLLTINN